MTDRDDPDRTALLIDAGADDVISRSSSDAEMLARVRRLFEHRARISDLSMQGVGGLYPDGMAEAAGGFTRAARVAIVSDTVAATDWASAIRRALRGAVVEVQEPSETLPSTADVVILDCDSLGERKTLHLTARAMRATGKTGPEVLIAGASPNPTVVVQALDVGAGGVLRLPLHPQETAARINLLNRRRQNVVKLRDSLRDGLQSAMTDPLTGLFNRRYALPRVEKMVSGVRTNGQPVTLMMCDLDHFKWVNDTFGHPAGDEVLKNIATVLRDAVANCGFAARVGGEEFLIALPACGQLAASSIARRIRKSVGDLITPYPAAPEGLNVTISIGFVTIDAETILPTDPAEAATHMLTRADRALYSAKAAGRDCVMSDSRQQPFEVTSRIRSAADRDRFHDQLAG